MALTPIHSGTKATTSATVATSLSMSGVATLNNLLVMVVATTSTSAAITISDTLGNTWTQAGSYQQAGGSVCRQSMWYCLCAASGSLTISISTSTATNFAIIATEFSGSATINSTVSAQGSSTSVSTGACTAASGDMVIAYYSTSPAAYSVGNPASPFANLTNVTGSVQARNAWATATGNATCTWTSSSSISWAAQAVSFTPSPPPSPDAPQPAVFFTTQIPQLPSLAPWTLPVFRAWPEVDEGGKDTGPPPPPPPPPPIPLPPPPPPGVPPTLPPDPPPRTGTYSPEITNDPTLERRIAFFTQQVSGLLNSLIRRNIIVYVGGENAWTINAPTFGGLTGSYGG